MNCGVSDQNPYSGFKSCLNYKLYSYLGGLQPERANAHLKYLPETSALIIKLKLEGVHNTNKTSNNLGYKVFLPPWIHIPIFWFWFCVFWSHLVLVFLCINLTQLNSQFTVYYRGTEVDVNQYENLHWMLFFVPPPGHYLTLQWW